MAIEDVKMFANSKLICYSATTGYTLLITSMTSGNTWTGTFSTNELTFLLPNRDRYKLQLKSGSTVLYTTYVELGFGECKYMDVGLTTTTWAGIKAIISAGQAANYIHNGDQFTVELSDNTTLVFEANVNTYGLGEVDFIPTYCLPTGRGMNTSNTNAGGWNACNNRSYLNETFFNMLPADLQAVISTKDVKATQGSQVNTLVTSTDKIWLLSEWEVFGARTYSGSAEDSVHVQYPIFTDANSRIRTLGASGAATYWWLCSPHISHSSYFCYVNTSGAPDYDYASTASGLLPCFRIAP